MAEEIKKTEKLKNAEESTAQDAQKLGDDAMDQVAGGAVVYVNGKAKFVVERF